MILGQVIRVYNRLKMSKISEQSKNSLNLDPKKV